MYRKEFALVYAALTLVAGGVVAFLIGWFGFSNHVRVETRMVQQPALSSSATVADVRGRFAEQPQTLPGADVAAQVATNCPHVDIYTQADGAVLVCHA